MTGSSARRRAVRYIQLGQAVSSLGDGVWFTTWAVYLTRVVGLPTTVMGAVVATAGIAGMLLSYPSGMAADRFGSRNTLLVMTALRGAASLGLCFVDNLAGLLPAAVILFGTQSAAAGVRTSLVCRLFDDEDQLGVLAQARVVQHIAYALGSVLGAAVLAANARSLFVAAVAFNAGTIFALTAITALLPRDRPPRQRHAATRGSTLRDFPYAALMLVTAVLALCWSLLSTAVPLWVRTRTSAPGWLSAVIVATSSVLIAVFQVRLTQGMRHLRLAGRAGGFAGALLAVCCIMFGAATWLRSPSLAIAALMLAGLFHVAGELYYVASRWGLSIGLMDAERAGRYQGVAATTEATVMAVGPAIMALVVTAPNISGWIVLAAAFGAVGLATPPLARWAQRTRPTLEDHNHAGIGRSRAVANRPRSAQRAN